MGLVPGLMAPTSSINVTLGCALTTWVYYHFQGIRENRASSKYIDALLGAARRAVVDRLHHVPDRDHQPHVARACRCRCGCSATSSAKSCVILILFSIVPFLVPLPMMFLGLITGGLQAFIFVLLSIIYLQGAVAVEHEHDEHGHDAPHGNHAPAAA